MVKVIQTSLSHEVRLYRIQFHVEYIQFSTVRFFHKKTMRFEFEQRCNFMSVASYGKETLWY